MKMIKKNKKYIIAYFIACLVGVVFSFFFRADKNAKIEDEALDIEQRQQGEDN